MENLEDTQNEELEQPIENEGTEDSNSSETLAFDESLESAETEEDILKVAEQLQQQEVVEEEPTNENTLDTETDTDTDEDEFDFAIGKGINLKDGDLELQITDKEQAIRLMQQGLNYSGKTTELARYRSFVKFAEDNGISIEDIQMLKDIKNGNKEAYAALAKEAEIDIYSVDENTAYQKQPVNLDQHMEDPMVEVVANEILSDENATQQFQKWFPYMPEQVQNLVTNNSQALTAVKNDINAGIFEPAMQQAITAMKVNGIDFDTAYIQAKQTLSAVQPMQEQQQQQPSRGERMRASATRSRSSSSSKRYSADVIRDMSDDDFLKNFESIISSVRADR